MKKIISFSGLFLLFFLATALHAREISWNKYVIPLTEEWQAEDLENNTSSQLTLVSEQQGIHATVKLSFRPLNKKPVTDSTAWLKAYTDKWISFKFSNSDILEKGPITLLGHKNCPVATGRKSTMAVYQFLPMIDGYIFNIIVNLDPYPEKPLPLFIVDFLERIRFNHHGGKISPEQVALPPEKTVAEVATEPRLPPPSLNEQFNETELKALDNRVTSVSDFFENADKQGLSSTMLPDQQQTFKIAIENASPRELALFGKALKSRRVIAMGRDLVEYEITDGAKTYAVSFILLDGKWYLYHF